MRLINCAIAVQLLQIAFTITVKCENRTVDECPFEGCRGDKGPLGPKGDRGPPGYCNCTGEAVLPTGFGRPGQKGDVGVSGRIGLPGKQGLKGETGEPSLQGIKGDPGLPGTCGVDNDTCAGQVGPVGLPGVPGRDGEKGEKGEPGIVTLTSPDAFGVLGESQVDVMDVSSSESCSLTLQGALRLDPITKQLYYCDGDQWTCLETTICRQAPCISPYGPRPIGGMWYQVFAQSVTQETQDAADIVLVVDESGSMNREHEWLLIMISLLEQALVEAGVGVGARNRYCMVGFGSFVTFERGHFILVDGEPCFLASDFPRARAQLSNAGLNEDGYEAIQFALDNIPFRDSPFIAKNIILITDEGRTPIPEGADLNFTSMETLLKKNDIILNVVVWADYVLRDNPDEIVLGVDYSGATYTLEPNGEYGIRDGPVEIINAEKDTAKSYVDLAIALGGASWALRILRESSITRNVTLQESFTSALTQIKVREISAQIESCRKCTCLAGQLSARVSCEIAEDEDFCQCVVANFGDENQCTPSETVFEDVEAPGGGDSVFGAGGPSSRRFSIPRAPDFSN